ncbi:Methyltransferase domain-containing protein [bacterium A37T11]|nr:Methyltransferase domain-containing protein [bacterium A37T11]
MSTKHYNAGYLENTADFLKNLKQQSYGGFASLQKGTLIDLGCGIGADAINLAKILGEKVNVVGIDHDQELLDKATESAMGLPNIRFIKKEVWDIPFEDKTVSGVRAERLIQHLSNPEQTFKEIYRVLKAGHPVVVLETVWDSLTFYTKHTSIEQQIRSYLTDNKVNNGWAANNLTSYLKDSSFNEIEVNRFPLTGRSLNDARQYLWIDKIMEEMLTGSYIDQQEYDVFNEALTEADNDSFFLCSLDLLLVSALK